MITSRSNPRLVVAEWLGQIRRMSKSSGSSLLEERIVEFSEPIIKNLAGYPGVQAGEERESGLLAASR